MVDENEEWPDDEATPEKQTKEDGLRRQGVKKPKKKIIAIVLFLLAILLLLLGIWFYGKKDSYYDPAANTGIIPGMTEAEIQEQLNRKVEEGMLNISISSNVTFASTKSKGKVNIQNIKGNHYDFKVKIKLDEDKRTIYASKALKPGQYIQYIKMKGNVKKGTHDATATFEAYTTDKHELVGSTAIKMKIKVEK